MEAFDKARAVTFAGRLMSTYSAGMLCHLIDLGARTGLFDAAALGPATSAELAGRAGLNERYVREWLGALVTGGVFEYDAERVTYTLPPEHAVCLAGPSFYNTSAIAAVVALTTTMADRVEVAFRDGGGVSYDEQPDELSELVDRLGRPRYDALLVDAYLPVVPGLVARLEAGAVVVDVGCGSGHVANLIAARFPASTVVGLDTSERGLAAGRTEAAELGLGNVRFECVDVDGLTGETYDLVTAFDVIHDLAHPEAALETIRRSLTPGGTFFMYDSAAPSALERQVALPWAPLMYGMSVFGCLGFSLAGGGTGLGNMWGRQTAEAMLRAAGFSEIALHDAPGDPVNAIFACRP
jgi:SAM-dependent methyltransferase